MKIPWNYCDLRGCIDLVLGYGYTNSKGTTIDMRKGHIICDSVKGLGSQANISTSKIAGFDGSTINSISIKDKNIALTVRNMGRLSNSISDRVYDLFRAGDSGTLLIYTETDTYTVNCVCKSVTPANFTKDDVFTISLYAEDPNIYSSKKESFIVANIQPLFQFDFTFPKTFKFSEISGTAFQDILNPYRDMGIKWTFKANAEVVNPGVISLGQDFGRENFYMQMNCNLHIGESIVINSIKGQKSITHIDYAGNETNFFNHKASNFTYLQLFEGINRLQRVADSGLVDFEIQGEYLPTRSGI